MTTYLRNHFGSTLLACVALFDFALAAFFTSSVGSAVWCSFCGVAALGFAAWTYRSEQGSVRLRAESKRLDAEWQAHLDHMRNDFPFPGQVGHTTTSKDYGDNV